MSSSHSVEQTDPAFPQIKDLFEGRVDQVLASILVHRYYRIESALYALCSGNLNDDTRRRRWRLGLYREVREMKRAIGNLVVAGCTGGEFFSSELIQFDWLDPRSQDMFIIDWTKMRPPPRPLKLQPWVTSVLPIQMLQENQWWKYNSRRVGGSATRPSWWDATEADVLLYLPETPVPIAQVKEQKHLLGIARELLRTMVNMIKNDGYPRLQEPHFV
ncbi:hypothetical protein QCA50_000860 [Cerrena zonata]|uniref:Uncharacterized protein n=1 Tax=Cerrena zonata TaxID=2478898 RepID=A0AAW0GZP5_9APHY